MLDTCRMLETLMLTALLGATVNEVDPTSIGARFWFAIDRSERATPPAAFVDLTGQYTVRPTDLCRQGDQPAVRTEGTQDRVAFDGGCLWLAPNAPRAQGFDFGKEDFTIYVVTISPRGHIFTAFQPGQELALTLGLEVEGGVLRTGGLAALSAKVSLAGAHLIAVARQGDELRLSVDGKVVATGKAAAPTTGEMLLLGFDPDVLKPTPFQGGVVELLGVKGPLSEENRGKVFKSFKHRTPGLRLPR